MFQTIICRNPCFIRLCFAIDDIEALIIRGEEVAILVLLDYVLQLLLY